MSKHWDIKLSEPFNTRVWNDIAFEAAFQAHQAGTSWMSFVKRPDGSIRVNLLPDDNLTETQSDDS